MGVFSKIVLKTVLIFTIGSFAISGNAFAQSATASPAATTLNATFITSSYALLQSYVNPNNTGDTSRWFEWGTSPSSLIYSVGQATQYVPANATEAIASLTPSTTYYYRIAARNSAGTVYGETLSFTTMGIPIPPLQSFPPSVQTPPAVTTYNAASVTQNSAILQGYVNSNGTSDTVRWFEYYPFSVGATLVTPRYYQGSSAANFSETVTNLLPNTTYYFRAAAQNSGGTTYGSYYTFSTGQSGTTAAPAGTSLLVITNAATGVGSANALLNGVALSGSGLAVSGWFEWGASAALGKSTAPKAIGAGTSVSFSETISGLLPNTPYYFRAVAQTQYGVVRGNILTFGTTESLAAPATSPPNPTSRIKNTPMVFLSIESDSEKALSGEDISYALNYRNEGGSEIKNLRIRVTLPAEISYKEGGAGFSMEDGALELNVPRLGAKESDRKIFRATVSRNLEKEKSITTTATLNYENASGIAQKQIEAYVVNIIEPEPTPASASLFGSVSERLLLWFIILFDFAAIAFILYLLRKRTGIVAA